MKKRVFVDLERTKYLYSGLGQYSLFLGENLKSLNRDLDLHFYFSDPKSRMGELSSSLAPNEWHRLFGVPTQGIDLWHSTWQDSSYLPRTKLPLLLTIHDLNFVHDKSEEKIKKRLKRLQKRADRSTCISTISHYTAELLKKHIDVKVPVEVIHNGLTMNLEENPLPLKQLGLSGGFLLSLGVFLRKKNVHSLLHMLKELPNERLVIAGGLGDSSYYDELKVLSQSSELEERVHFVGEVDAREKLWLYKNAKAFLFPSTQEGFGLPVIEAMSCGTPVFCSDRTSLPEVAGELAFYWPSFEPSRMAQVFMGGMKRVESDASWSEKLKAHAQRYSWKKAAGQYLELYHRILDKKL